ncbi:MAG: hypothetical protein ACUVUC_12475 [Thermoguttaceae bacterium]
MTPRTYDPHVLDQFALRLLDLAAVLRHMAHRARENPVEDPPFDDSRGRDLIERLEYWARTCLAELEMKIMRKGAASPKAVGSRQ